MSWIFGILSRAILPSFVQRSSSIHTAPLHVVSTQGMYLALGGIPETCRFEQCTIDEGWAVVGLGLVPKDDHVRFVSAQEWKVVLSKPDPLLAQFDGHFVAIRWGSGKLELLTDQLGLRTVYMAKFEDGVCFSTRLAWVARFSHKNEIDFPSFGSRWLTFSQLGVDSVIGGIDRLGPLGRACITPTSVHSTSQAWLPTRKTSSVERVVSVLTAFSNPLLDKDVKLSLGLSGGIDSRVLLTLLQKNQRGRFTVHAFGHPDDPDVKASAALAELLNLDPVYFNSSIPEGSLSIRDVQEFASQAELMEPASSYFRLRFYPHLYQQGKVMIDGGFGEVARRQYMNRVLLRGRIALLRQDIERLYRLISLPRSPFFTKETLAAMEAGAKSQLANILRAMPSLREWGSENFVDLLAVRTRLQNWGGPEQARMDSLVLNYMPFAQPSFLREVPLSSDT